jgi:collagenase-like PrtC family protease
MAAGKQVVLSTLALVTSPREIKAVRDPCEAGFLVEANDVSCLCVLSGRPHVIGPLINLFNEGSLAYMARSGAIRVIPPPEVSAAGIGVLAAHAGDMEVEAIVFGRQVLSVSARHKMRRSPGRDDDESQSRIFLKLDVNDALTDKFLHSPERWNDFGHASLITAINYFGSRVVPPRG